MAETRVFQKEKETKGTFRYMELEVENQPIILRNVYVSKSSPLCKEDRLVITVKGANE